MSMNPPWESDANSRAGVRLGFNYWINKVHGPAEVSGDGGGADRSIPCTRIQPEELIDLMRCVLSPNPSDTLRSSYVPKVQMPEFVEIKGTETGRTMDGSTAPAKAPHSVCLVSLQGAGASRVSDFLSLIEHDADRRSDSDDTVPGATHPSNEDDAGEGQESANVAKERRRSQSFLSTCSRVPIAYGDAAPSTAAAVHGVAAVLLWPQTRHIICQSNYMQIPADGTIADFLGRNTVYFQGRHVLWNDTLVLRPLSNDNPPKTSEDTNYRKSNMPSIESIYARSEIRSVLHSPRDGDVVGTYSRSKHRDSGIYVLRWLDGGYILFLWDIVSADLQILSCCVTEAAQLKNLGSSSLFASQEYALFRDRKIPICELYMTFYSPAYLPTTHTVSLRRREEEHSTNPLVASSSDDELSDPEDGEDMPRAKRAKLELIPDSYKETNPLDLEVHGIEALFRAIDVSRLNALLVSSRLRCLNGYPELEDFWGTESVYVSSARAIVGGESVRLNKTLWAAAQLFSCDAFLGLDPDYSDLPEYSNSAGGIKGKESEAEREEGEEDGEEGEEGQERDNLQEESMSSSESKSSAGYEVLESLYLKARGDRSIEPLRLCAIDCEMCETAEGLCLTRFTLICPDHGALIDCLIKPREKIVNYWTEFSGISEADLENVTSTIGDLHRLLASYNIIDGKTIIVGHSLESDLKAARLVHATIIDSALLYPHEKGFPHKHSLKYLADLHLGKSIQEGEGHDSIEDAVIALELVAHYVSNDIGKGAPVWPREYRTSLFDGHCISPDVNAPLEIAMFGCSTIHSSSKLSFDANAWETRVFDYSCENNCCATVSRLSENLSTPQGVVVSACKQYYDADEGYAACMDYLSSSKVEPSGVHRRLFTWLDLPVDVIRAADDAAPLHMKSMHDADQALGAIFDSLSPGTLLFVVTQGSIEVLRYLSAMKQRARWENDASGQRRNVAFSRSLAPWAAGSDETELLRVVQDASCGTLFLRIK